MLRGIGVFVIYFEKRLAFSKNSCNTAVERYAVYIITPEFAPTSTWGNASDTVAKIFRKPKISVRAGRNTMRSRSGGNGEFFTDS